MNKIPPLLSRQSFRDAVFTRDRNTCVFCARPASDAHHILERRLWADGGYYVDNGACVCDEHHRLCEQTVISVEDIRHACGIRNRIVPDHLYADQRYDKWGNPVLANGLRIRGELFYDQSVQKILAAGHALDLFTKYIKHPRTFHLPWSESISKDDRVITNFAHFIGKRVIVTIKMDGENTTCYNDHMHARSVDSDNHPSRNWAKNFSSKFAADIPDDFRICCENVYATHSIRYNALATYLFGFSVWQGLTCLAWDDTIEWFELLGIQPVEVRYDGIYDETKIKACFSDQDWNVCEGYVIRLADKFEYREFRNSVAKFVRRNHLTTSPHNWLHTNNFTINQLRGSDHDRRRTI